MRAIGAVLIARAFFSFRVNMLFVKELSTVAALLVATILGFYRSVRLILSRIIY